MLRFSGLSSLGVHGEHSGLLVDVANKASDWHVAHKPSTCCCLVSRRTVKLVWVVGVAQAEGMKVMSSSQFSCDIRRP